METDYKIYQNAIKNCIEVHKSRLIAENMKELETRMGKYSYIEFQTLFLSFGRACGHTTYIMENTTLNDLIVVAKSSQRILLEYEHTYNKHIITIDEICNQRFRGMGHDVKRNVWIDGNRAFQLLRKKEAEYFSFLTYFMPEQIIVLGE